MDQNTGAHAAQQGKDERTRIYSEQAVPFLSPQVHDLSPCPSDHLFTRSFLHAITGPFGDQNVKGSITRVLSVIATASLTEAEVLLCLVRAYTIARDTQTLRPAHYDQETGQANRMPLFCTLFERFAQTRVQGGKWAYSWQQMEEAIATDAHLAPWWQEHHSLTTLLVDPPVAQNEDPLSQGETACPEEAEMPAPQATETFSCDSSHPRLSQTDEQREVRATRARQFVRTLSRMALPIQDAIILWEHVTCGCPLYHRPQGREVCAFCFPDPAWPEEVRFLLHATVKGTIATDEQTGERAKALLADPLTGYDLQHPFAEWPLQERKGDLRDHLRASFSRLPIQPGISAT